MTASMTIFLLIRRTLSVHTTPTTPTTPSHHTLLQGYTRPDVVEEAVFEVRGGAHPVVSSLRQGSFIHNHCDMSDHRLWIITGPNMGGEMCQVLTSCSV